MVEVKISEASVYKIEPGKKYIIAFDDRTITRRDAASLCEVIKEFGAEGVAIGLRSGAVDDSIKIIELPKKEVKDGNQTQAQ